MPAMLFVRGLIAFFVLNFIFIVTLVAVSYYLFIKTERFFYRILILDFTHTLFLAPIIFVIVVALGGASQAVVEGVAGTILFRYTQYAIATMFVLLFAQILIIPWSLFCNRLFINNGINGKGKTRLAANTAHNSQP
jgi:hypothetical protein